MSPATPAPVPIMNWLLGLARRHDHPPADRPPPPGFADDDACMSADLDHPLAPGKDPVKSSATAAATWRLSSVSERFRIKRLFGSAVVLTIGVPFVISIDLHQAPIPGIARHIKTPFGNNSKWRLRA